jgi:hypothetical protein
MISKTRQVRLRGSVSKTGCPVSSRHFPASAGGRGAIGFTDEHDIGLYLKRAMLLSSLFGNAAAQRRR